MTPDKRLDQIEPVMADVLQKVDRLVEGQGQIIEVVTRADQNANIAAKGVASLTVATQKQFEVLKVGQDELRANQEQLRANQEEFKANQELILQILREKLR